MISFYTWPRALCYTITFLFDLCVVSQTIALVLSFFRRPRNKNWLLETLLELLVLVQVLSYSMLHGQAIQGFIMSLVIPSGYVTLRFTVFSALVLLALAASARPTITLSQSVKTHLPVIAAAFLTLPPMEKPGQSFAYLFLAALFFYLVRGIRSAIRYYLEIKSKLSAFSVKDAIDSMHSGILFSESDGYILLSNTQMEKLIKTIFGRKVPRNLPPSERQRTKVPLRNANWLYERLVSGDIDSAINTSGAAYQTSMFEGKIVCLLPDGKTWMFTKTELRIGRRNYVQISAADVTERWQLTAQLQAKAGELRQRNEALTETIAKLYSLSRERETQRAKWRAHNLLGQSLTLLLRGIRNGDVIDYKQLLSVSRGFLDSLQSGGPSPNPRDEFESLKQSFASIGVEIRLEGELPSSGEKALLFPEIIREAVTNAVRHGFATLVTIAITCNNTSETSAVWHLQIHDNGRPSAAPLVEGGGLGGMRKKIASYGGNLELLTEPGFTLKVEIAE